MASEKKGLTSRLGVSEIALTPVLAFVCVSEEGGPSEDFTPGQTMHNGQATAASASKFKGEVVWVPPVADPKNKATFTVVDSDTGSGKKVFLEDGYGGLKVFSSDELDNLPFLSLANGLSRDGGDPSRRVMAWDLPEEVFKGQVSAFKEYLALSYEKGTFKDIRPIFVLAATHDMAGESMMNNSWVTNMANPGEVYPYAVVGVTNNGLELLPAHDLAVAALTSTKCFESVKLMGRVLVKLKQLTKQRGDSGGPITQQVNDKLKGLATTFAIGLEEYMKASQFKVSSTDSEDSLFGDPGLALLPFVCPNDPRPLSNPIGFELREDNFTQKLKAGGDFGENGAGRKFGLAVDYATGKVAFQMPFRLAVPVAIAIKTLDPEKMIDVEASKEVLADKKYQDIMSQVQVSYGQILATVGRSRAAAEKAAATTGKEKTLSEENQQDLDSEETAPTRVLH